MIPFQITFHELSESDAVWMAVQKRIERLEHLYNRITKCEVVISCPHRHRHADRLYNIQIHIHIPRSNVVVTRNPPQREQHRDIYVAVRDAFQAAERSLLEKVRILRHEVKFHEYDLGRALRKKNRSSDDDQVVTISTDFFH